MLEQAVKNLKIDMDRMNGQISKYEGMTEGLVNDNQMLELEFQSKLKQIESSCSEMETYIEDIKAEKEVMTAEVIEAEKQIMLWERKISLEKEMQSALDPTVGAGETTAMKKEIHRMGLRLDQLKRRQESIIKEMERAIYKRDSIQQKFEPAAAAAKSKASGGAMNAKRQIENLKRNLKAATEQRGVVEEDIIRKEGTLQDLQNTIVQASEETNKLEQMSIDLGANIVVTKVVTEINKCKIDSLASASAEMDIVKELTAQAQAGDVEQYVKQRTAGVDVDAELTAAENERAKLELMVKHFREKFSQVEAFHPQLWASFYEVVQ